MTNKVFPDSGVVQKPPHGAVQGNGATAIMPESAVTTVLNDPESAQSSAIQVSTRVSSTDGWYGAIIRLVVNRYEFPRGGAAVAGLETPPFDRPNSADRRVVILVFLVAFGFVTFQAFMPLVYQEDGEVTVDQVLKPALIVGVKAALAAPYLTALQEHYIGDIQRPLFEVVSPFWFMVLSLVIPSAMYVALIMAAGQYFPANIVAWIILWQNSTLITLVLANVSFRKHWRAIYDFTVFCLSVYEATYTLATAYQYLFFLIGESAVGQTMLALVYEFLLFLIKANGRKAAGLPHFGIVATDCWAEGAASAVLFATMGKMDSVGGFVTLLVGQLVGLSCTFLQHCDRLRPRFEAMYRKLGIPVLNLSTDQRRERVALRFACAGSTQVLVAGYIIAFISWVREGPSSDVYTFGNWTNDEVDQGNMFLFVWIVAHIFLFAVGRRLMMKHWEKDPLLFFWLAVQEHPILFMTCFSQPLMPLTTIHHKLGQVIWLFEDGSG